MPFALPTMWSLHVQYVSVRMRYNMLRIFTRNIVVICESGFICGCGGKNVWLVGKPVNPTCKCGLRVECVGNRRARG